MNNKCCRNKKSCCQEEPKKTIRDYMKLGFAFWLTVVFVALKLFGAINWSWLWVFSPLWIGYGLVIFILTLYVLLAAIARQTTSLRIKITKKQKEKAED
jgi:fatty acid desaturase